MAKDASIKPKVGRPRSEKARVAIITATDVLLREMGGTGLTIEAIAKRAGVGKPTIYRWWPSMADIVLEVLLHRAGREIPVEQGETLEHTLRLFLRRSMQAIHDGSGAHLRFLMAQAQQDEAFRQRFREKFTAQRRGVLREILVEAAEKGGQDMDHDPDLLVDMIFGAMWYRLLTGHGPLDQAFADQLAGLAAGLARVSDGAS